MYLSMRGADTSDMTRIWGNLDWRHFFSVLAAMLLLPVLRAYRLQFLLARMESIKFWQIFRINCVGYLFIFLLPMRLGEFVIPYLTKKNSIISLSAAMGSIVLERVTDLVVLTSIMAITTYFSDLPGWVNNTILIAFSLLACGCLILAVVYIRPEFAFRIFEKLFFFAPKNLRERIRHMFLEFHKGLAAIGSTARFVVMVLQSVIIWILSSVGAFFTFKMFGWNLGFEAAVFLMCLNTIGIALPAGPGMVGNFQYSCILALSAFGIAKPEGFAFANLYYILGIGSTVILGISQIPFVKFKLSEVRSELRAVIKG
jgi:glycosyltransferase 2 family protein